MARSVRFGQNFLINKKVAEKIAKNLFPVYGIIFEIGPGNGILTDFLYKYRKESKIIAVEFDQKLCKKIEEKYKFNFEAMNANILDIKLDDSFPDNSINLISSVPYYISKDIIDWIIFNRNKIEKGILMMQKEFVNKLIEREDSAQSILFRFLFYSKKLFYVNPGSFYPQPKVVSSVFSFKKIIREQKEEVNIKEFYVFLKKCFMNRRKILLNNLSDEFNRESAKIVLIKNKINLNIRAEELKLENFLEIYRNILN